MLRLRGVGDLNCPGDPGCPGYVAPGSADYQTSLLQEILANQQTGGAVASSTGTAATSGSVTSWLNGNAGVVAIAAAVAVLFMAGGRR